MALKVRNGLLDDWWDGIPLVLAEKFQRNSKLLREEKRVEVNEMFF